VRAHRDAPAVLAGGYDAPPTLSEGGTARVVLFDQENLRGDSMAVAGINGSLASAGFDNAASSMVIEGGRWLFCTEPYFRGECQVLGPGRYPTLTKGPLFRNISSIRPAAVADVPAPRANPAGDIELFADADFKGRVFGSKRDVANLGPTDFNDRASSVIVNSGQWELCTDGQYGGRCSVFGPGRYPGLGGLANQISSLRRIR
jgi:hypothetical protein